MTMTAPSMSAQRARMLIVLAAALASLRGPVAAGAAEQSAAAQPPVQSPASEARSPAIATASSVAAAPADASPASSAAIASTAAPAPVAIEVHGLPSEAEAMRLCEIFLTRIISADYPAAFETVQPYFPITAQQFDRLKEETRKQHGLAELQFGKPVGQVFVSVDRIADTVLRYRFLEKFDVDVVYWEFVFYKPHGEWILNGLGLDDKLEDLFRR